MGDDTVDILIRAKNQINAEFRDLEGKLRGLKSAAEDTSGPGGLAKLQTGVRSMTGLFAAFAGVSLAAAAKSALEFGGHITDLSARVGLSVETLGRMRYSAEGAGNTLDQVAVASGQLGKRLADGDTSAVSAVERLGLNFSTLRAMSPDEQIRTIAIAFDGVSSAGERSAIAMGLFGRQGIELLPFFSDYAKQAGEDMGTLRVLTDEEAQALDALGDAFGEMRIAGEVALGKLIAGFIGLTKAANDSIPTWAKVAIAFRTRDYESFGQTLPTVRGEIGKLTTAAGPLTDALARQKQIEKELAEGLKTGNARRAEAQKASEDLAGAVAKLAEEGDKQGRQLRTAVDAIWPDHLGMLAREKAAMEASTAALINRISAEDVLLERIQTRSRVSLATLGPQARGQNAGADATGFADLAGLGDLLQGGNLAGLVLGAVQGGGNIGSALGSGLGSAAFGSLGNALGLASSSFLGTLLPGVGALLGPLAGQALSALSGVFTGGEEAQVVNPERDRFLAQFGGAGTGEGSGFLTLAAKLTEITGQEGGGDIFARLMNASTAKDFEAAVRDVNAALADTTAASDALADANALDFGRMQSIAEEFGIDLRALGPDFEAAKIGDQARDYAEKLQYLMDHGTSVGTALSGAADELSALASEARRTGVELPKSMEPWLQNLADTGQLLDENGEKVTSLSGINFSEPMSEGFDRVVAAIGTLTEVLTVDLPEAADASARGIEDAYSRIRIDPIRVPVEVEGFDGLPEGSIPGFASGSRGVRDFGRGTLAVLHDREIVQTEDQWLAALAGAVSAGRGLAAGGVTVHVDARESSFRDVASVDRFADRVGEAVMARLRLQTRLQSSAF